MRSLCVFCGSKRGNNSAFAETATELGHTLAEQGIRLVYGGGAVGLMGTLADAVLEGNGKVFGVLPRGLARREVRHQGVTDLRLVGTMHERKALMADNADGFLALPGGLGTLEELCEIYTWAQIGIHHKPVAILNVQGYFDPLLLFLDRATDEGFMNPKYRRMLIVGESVSDTLAKMRDYRATDIEPWMDRSQT